MTDPKDVRFLQLHETDTAHWALLTCPHHRAGDVEVEHEGAFTRVRCRECVREAERAGDPPA